MSKDIQEVARGLVTRALQHTDLKPGRSASKALRGRSRPSTPSLGGFNGIAAGAGAAMLAPAAWKAVRSGGPSKLLGGAASEVGDAVGGKVSEKVDEAGGPSGILKDALPFGGGGGDGKSGAPGVGKGRRMPIQQSVDIGVALETVYNQWTQFEDWPNFMHRVSRVSQQDETTLSFATKIWGKTKEFTATIETQRPDQRIKWTVSQGLTHQGVVTFHELGPNLTRVMLSMDVEPGGLLEKAARGMRHIKRAARADLHRFKAFMEMNEQETGAWRGVVEDGEVVEEHDSSYDDDREYADVKELANPDASHDAGGGDEGEPEGSEDGDESGAEDETEAQDAPKPRGRSRSTSRNGGEPKATRGTGSRSGNGSGSGSGSGRKRSSSSASRTSSNGHSGRQRSSSGSRRND